MVIVHILTRLLKAGSEENTLEACKHQIQSGHKVALIYGVEVDQDVLRIAVEAGVDCHQVPSLVKHVSPIQDYQAIKSIRQILRSSASDLVHTHQSKAGVLGRLAAIGLGSKIVHGIHIVPFENVGFFTKWLYIGAEKICARFTDEFISVSLGTRDVYLSNSIGELSNHHVVYSPMDVQKFSSRKSNNGLGESHDVEKRKFVIVMLATFEKRKRHRELLEEIKDVLKQNENIQLFLCGDGEEKDAIYEQVANYGLTDQVVFTGFVEDPENYIAQADVGLLVSEREGLPRVLVQFLAAGVPVVTSWLQGIEEIVDHRVNGFITDQNDLNEVAQVIECLALDHRKYRKVKEAASTFNAERWDHSTNGLEIDVIYQKAMSA